MRIGILVFKSPENSIEPQHFVSKTMAEKFLSYRPNGRPVVEKVHDFLLKIVADISFQKLKSLFRHSERDHAPRSKQDIEAQLALRDLRNNRMPRATLENTKTAGPLVEASKSLRFWVLAANKIMRVKYLQHMNCACDYPLKDQRSCV